MSFANKSLENNEKLIYEARISLWSFHKIYLLISLLLILYFFTGFLIHNDDFIYKQILDSYNAFFSIQKPTLTIKVLHFFNLKFLQLKNTILTIPNIIIYGDYFQQLLIFMIVVLFSYAFARYKTTELALTDKKILLKKGIIAIKCLELELNKVGAIQIHQTFLGRLLNYGTLIMTGAGLPQASMKSVRKPMAFRNKFLHLKTSGRPTYFNNQREQQQNNINNNNINNNKPPSYQSINTIQHDVIHHDNLLQDKIYINKYEIISKIASSSSGTIYLANDIILNKEVALKVLETEINTDYEYKTLLNEVKKSSSFQHPNIINVFDAGKESDIFYVIFEYFESKTLKEYIHSILFKNKEQINILKQILLGLNYIHEKNVVHTNLKSANILYNRKTKIAKIADFNVSKLYNIDINPTKKFSGTPSYMAPEQFNNDYDMRSDIFSFGVVAYELLTTKLPFTEDNLPELRKEPKPLKEQGIDPFLSDIIHKCLNTNKEDRYQSVKEILHDLEKISHHPV